MGAQICPNCGVCTCTGSYLVRASDGTMGCSKCVAFLNNNALKNSKLKK